MKTILIAEDYPQLRELVREILINSGYSVLEAGDGEEALRIAEAHTNDIHLLLTDIAMPGMTGIALAEQVKRLRPAIRVLYITGTPELAAALPQKSVCMPKPFTPSALVRKISEVIG